MWPSFKYLFEDKEQKRAAAATKAAQQEAKETEGEKLSVLCVQPWLCDCDGDGSAVPKCGRAKHGRGGGGCAWSRPRRAPRARVLKAVLLLGIVSGQMCSPVWFCLLQCGAHFIGWCWFGVRMERTGKAPGRRNTQVSVIERKRSGGRGCLEEGRLGVPGQVWEFRFSPSFPSFPRENCSSRNVWENASKSQTSFFQTSAVF